MPPPTPNPPGYRPAIHNSPSTLMKPTNASVGPAAVARNYGYTGTIDHGNGDGTLRAQNAQGHWVTSDKQGRFPEQIEDEQRQADAKVQEQQAQQERRDTLARTNGVFPRTAKWDDRGTLLGGIHMGDGSVITRGSNGKLGSDGRPNPQLVSQLNLEAANPNSGGSALQPPQAGIHADGASTPVVASAPSTPPQVPTGPLVQPIAGDADHRAVLTRDWVAATRRDGTQVPTIPTAPPARTVADNYRSGSSYDTQRATNDYAQGKISRADLAHVQATAAKVGDSPDPVTPATQQPLGRQYGSSRIIPTTPAPAPLPSANDPQHTVATRINVPGGGTVTIPAYDGQAPDGQAPQGSGISINGVRQAVGSGSAGLAHEVTPTIPITPSDGYVSGLGGSASPAAIAESVGLVPPASSGYTSGLGGVASPAPVVHTPQEVARTVRSAVPGGDAITQARSQTAAGQASGNFGDYNNPNDGMYTAGAKGLAGTLPTATPTQVPTGGIGVASTLGSTNTLNAARTAATASATSFPGSASTAGGIAARADGALKFPDAPKVGEMPKPLTPLASTTPAGISGFGDNAVGTSKVPSIPGPVSSANPISYGVISGNDPSKPPLVPTTPAPNPQDDERKRLAASTP